MKNITTQFFEFRGSHYDFGLAQGKRLINTALYKNYREVNKPRKRPRYVVDLNKAYDLLSKYSPRQWRELQGLADGLDVSLEEAVTNYSGYQQEWKKSGCSIITGNDFLVRNYDYHPKTYEGRFVIYQPDEGYATIGPSQRITGRADGMNEHGLTMGYNFVHRRNPGDGFICNAITRMVLENCKDNREALAMLKELPHRHSFNYLVYDKQGNSHVVEGSPRNVTVKEAQISTNHFDIQTTENRYHLEDSKRRMALLSKNMEKLHSPYQAFRFFNDRDKGVFSEKYANWAGTLHTSAYIPSKLSVWFAVGGDREPFVISFKDWLAGKDSKIKQLRGFLNTEEPMPFMEG
ncbi:C45 family autoproteolytic acyltransferase/hydolase [Sediminibacillus albus]|uniref:Predicted choloylglycine hydrolase n=1 Tax=Sediminibacillus albus TaxID=407036 RepID=A0A1G8VV78_9BACI|nr:C45 family peptidase [Sediminibacillus albus]SDJ69879.1 Predicted choloylglycine hydrolase [Sediminibacillus albus]